MLPLLFGESGDRVHILVPVTVTSHGHQSGALNVLQPCFLKSPMACVNLHRQLATMMALSGVWKLSCGQSRPTRDNICLMCV